MVKVESFQTVIAVPPEDRFHFITHVSLLLSSSVVRPFGNRHSWDFLASLLRMHRHHPYSSSLLSTAEPLSTWSSQFQLLRTSYEEVRANHMDVLLRAQRLETHSGQETRESSRYRALHDIETMVRKDCSRTFSNLLFFKSSVVQALVVRLLLIFAVEHPQLGYKQGMTDILAILLLCLFCERWRGNSDDSFGGMSRHTRELLDSHLKVDRGRMEEEIAAVAQLLGQWRKLRVEVPSSRESWKRCVI